MVARSHLPAKRASSSNHTGSDHIPGQGEEGNPPWPHLKAQVGGHEVQRQKGSYPLNEFLSVQYQIVNYRHDVVQQISRTALLFSYPCSALALLKYMLLEVWSPD